MIGVVVPAYNERELIEETLAGIPDYVDRIYAVDDASTDETADIIRSLAKKDGRITLIKHEQNRGVGGAIVSGYKRALEDGIDITAVMAGDNQMDPAQLPRLLDPIVEGRADYTKGNRLQGPEFRKGMPRWRFLGNSILTLLTKIGSGYWQVMDPQNGYTAVSKRVLEEIPLDSIYPRYGYCNNLLVKLNVYGFKVMDIAIPARYGREKSKIRYGTYIPKVSWLLLKDFIWRLNMKYVLLSFHPLVLFYFLGVILAATGIFSGTCFLISRLVTRGTFFVGGSFSLLLLATGVLFLFLAMLLDSGKSKKESRSVTDARFHDRAV